MMLDTPSLSLRREIPIFDLYILAVTGHVREVVTVIQIWLGIAKPVVNKRWSMMGWVIKGRDYCTYIYTPNY